MNIKDIIGTAAILAALLLAPLSARSAVWPDCFADGVYDFSPAPPAYFGHDLLPDQVLGLPSESLPTFGALGVVSLGPGGSITLEFADNVIVDRPGPDFIVFENAFFVGSVPGTSTSPFCVFAEPVMVEASDDGINWKPFPYDAGALALAGDTSYARPFCGDTILDLVGLAGITPTFSGDVIAADDPYTWDPAGTGGVSGRGGDAFDLADVGLASARYVRLTDSGMHFGIDGAGSEGADIDTVIALHASPASTAETDSDGDGLPDKLEKSVGLDPHNPDTDGDGMNDGDELASCQNPLLFGDTDSGIDVSLIMYPPSGSSGGGSGGTGGCMLAADGGRANGAWIVMLLPLFFGLFGKYFLRLSRGRTRG